MSTVAQFDTLRYVQNRAVQARYIAVQRDAGAGCF
jgi:hypothetical protein